MFDQWVSPKAQIKALAKAVSTAFAASTLTPEEQYPGKIEITDLPWATPPLVAPMMLDGAPLHDYLDSAIRLEQGRLVEFWQRTLHDMWYTPSRILRAGALTNCGWAMPRVAVGQRALRFARPNGYPAQLDETAGLMFSLEVAHAARISFPVLEMVLDESNYLITLDDGTELGVKDGRPLVDSPWSYDASGQVLDLLSMTRGEVTYNCLYDELASVRSVLHVHAKRFPHNFEALDLALQALRVLSLGERCPTLIQAMAVAPIDMARLKEQAWALAEALDVMRAPNVSDRDKLHTLHSVLVPTVVSRMGFRQNIFAGATYPFCLAAGKAEQITRWLEARYRALPPELQQEGVCSQ